MRHALSAAVALGSLLLAPEAEAGPNRFTAVLDVAGSGRLIDTGDPDRAAFGLGLGLQLDGEVANFQFKSDVRYFEAEAFSAGEGRYVDVSFGISTPAALIFCFDVHEVYARSVGRHFDGMVYAAGGLGLKGRIARNTLKATLGGIYLHGPGSRLLGVDPERQVGGGPFVGVEHMLRLDVIQTTVRAGAFVAFHDSQAFAGFLADADLTLMFPVGKTALGPRLDVATRHFPPGEEGRMLGLRTEVSAHLGFAVSWGVTAD